MGQYYSTAAIEKQNGDSQPSSLIYLADWAGALMLAPEAALGSRHVFSTFAGIEVLRLLLTDPLLPAHDGMLPWVQGFGLKVQGFGLRVCGLLAELWNYLRTRV